MRNCLINPNKNIFTVFVGLIISGYNLTEESYFREIIKAIKEINYDEKVVNYFKKSRTETCKVNPYWPRAFLLALAGLFITEESPYKYTDFNKLICYINSLQQINPNEKNEELIDWLRELPIIIDRLQKNIKIQGIWAKYISILNNNVERYRLICNQAVLSVKDKIDISDDELPEIIIIPNPLQAPQATDFASIGNKVYIIKAEPDMDSVIHELLHYILGPRLEECRELINKYVYLLKPVLNDMISYQYAWDYDEDSWNRVFEENFMRAASIWINFYDNKSDAGKNAILHKNYGFIYVPAILEQLFTQWRGLNNFRSFIEGFLQELKRIGEKK